VGFGGWGLGFGGWAQPPNPQSPIPNPQSPFSFLFSYINKKIIINRKDIIILLNKNLNIAYLFFNLIKKCHQ
jgi:hypothetical protein